MIMQLECGMRITAFILLISALITYKIGAVCPSECNGHGLCDVYSRCTCSAGYMGGDCSLRICPSGIAWSDQATATDKAHAPAECSNRGLCDRTVGICKCMDGFTGKACERLKCPNNCNGKGVCSSLQRKAADTRNELSQLFTYDTPWDAPKIFGCICDPSSTGYDCSLSICPDGDDPLTKGQMNEVQLVVCTAISGSFVLYYKGTASASIPYQATPTVVQQALLQIPAVTKVNVTFSQPGGICQSTVNVVLVTFLEQFGNLSPLVPLIDSAMTAKGGTVKVYADGSTRIVDVSGKKFKSIIGTKESDPCANRGLCLADGTCSCFTSNGDAYGSSDGYGHAGIRGDCGFITSSAGGIVSSCPSDIQCSGHGVCNAQTYRCSCAVGWTAADCSDRTCPNGLSWFAYPSADNVAHTTYSECSDMGICNRATGECACQPGFYGQGCEYMECGGGLNAACNGHGRCLSMFELAQYSVINGDATQFTYGLDPNNHMTWDGHRIRGCLCDVGFEGFDCSLRQCPRGDDLGTYNQTDEVQLFQCAATLGTFTLSFRQKVTIPLHVNITAIMLQEALQKLSTINNLVTVSVLNTTGTISAPICSPYGTNIVRVKFNSVHGNLPTLIPDTSRLINSHRLYGRLGSGTIIVATDGQKFGNFTSIKGTTENAVCNNRGICDQSTGRCKCFAGWASSDGLGNIGQLGDCGFRLPSADYGISGSNSMYN